MHIEDVHDYSNSSELVNAVASITKNMLTFSNFLCLQ